MSAGDARRSIPGVDRLLASDAFAALAADAPRELLVRTIQAVQDEVRASLAGGVGTDGARLPEPDWYAERVRLRLAEALRPSLRRVINATGVVLHTNLGRAPLAAAAREAAALAAAGYSNLEYDLDEGRRGSRYVHCAGLLEELTGAEAALVVNNNAAAVVLALNTLADGREAVVSRGELVEIGGSFRIPEIMARSGARMVEVGATNKTHLSDYRDALGTGTGVVLKVHRSNFRVTGFTAEVGLVELVALAAPHGVPVLNDLGSGLLLDPSSLGLPPEPTAGDALRAGADLVTMSGDKLLGGPQAGIVLGRGELVERMKRNPLCRALRVDKVTLAALGATLALYREPERARREIPTLRMLTAAPEELAARAQLLAERLRAAGVAASTIAGASAVGGGAYPDVELPTTLVLLDVESPSADTLSARLRSGATPVIARVVQDRLAIDTRTLLDAEEETALIDAVSAALG